MPNAVRVVLMIVILMATEAAATAVAKAMLNESEPWGFLPAMRFKIPLEIPSPLPPPTSSMSRGIFVLGDSSVDCGENTLFYPFLRRDLSLFPCNESGPTLIPHFLAEKMGLPRIPSFYSQRGGTIQGLLSGLNFGSVQATIMVNPSTQRFQSLNQQLRQASESIQLLYLQLGEAMANQLIKSSIFYLSFGKDDYIHFLLHGSSSSNIMSEPEKFVRILVNQMTRAIRELYYANARKILCMGMLPLGCAPRVVVDWYLATRRVKGGRGCVSQVNHLVLEYNRLLKEHILDLKIKLPDAHIVFCDVYQGMWEIMANASHFGFEDMRSACCGLGWRRAGAACLSMRMACRQPSRYLWWDYYNPTQAVNSLLAESVWSGQPLANMCNPMTVQDMDRTE